MSKFRIYKVSAGKRQAKKIFFKPFLKKEVVSYDVVFTLTCLYDLDNLSQYNINNLFGINLGFNSWAAFGWKPTKIGTIQLHAFYSYNGKNRVKRLAEIKSNVTYRLTLKIRPEAYYLSVFDNESKVVCYHKINKKQTPNYGFETLIKMNGANLPRNDVFILMRRLK